MTTRDRHTGTDAPPRTPPPKDAPPGSILGRPVRVAIAADTYAEVNGVALIYQNLVRWAEQTGSMKVVVVGMLRTRRIEAGEHTRVALLPPVPNLHYPAYKELPAGIPRVGELLAELRAFEPDILHVTAPGPMGLFARYAAGRLGCVRTGYYHTRMPSYLEDYATDLFVPSRLRGTRLHGLARRLVGPWGNLLGRVCNRLIFGGCKTVFIQSRSMVGEALNAVGQAEHDRRGRTVQVLTGVAHDRFRVAPELGRAFRKRFDIPAEKPLGVYVGRIAIEKSVDDLGRLASEFRRRGIEIVLVGDGPFKKAFEEMFPDVLVTGYLFGDDLVGAYNAADAYLFPSTTDTFGNVVLEAMACGTPVVVTNIGGPVATVKHAGGAGLVYDPATETDKLPQLVADFLADRVRYDEVVEQSLAFARRYTWHAAFEGMRRVYESVAAGWHPADLGRDGPEDDLVFESPIG